MGSPEKVFVEAQDYSGASLNVKISVRSPKDNSREVASESVTLTLAKNYQDLVEIEVSCSSHTTRSGGGCQKCVDVFYSEIRLLAQ